MQQAISRLAEGRYFLPDRPYEGRYLPGNGRHGNRFGLSGIYQSSVASAQPYLPFHAIAQTDFGRPTSLALIVELILAG